MTDIVERLLDYSKDDHERGCQGRFYDCSCGYDDKRDPLMVEAAKTIASLRDENASLASWQCEFTDGKTGLVYAEGGGTYCAMAKEVERLRVQNIQMQAALGYAICAEDERHIIPSNPYKCGVCDSRMKAWKEQSDDR